MTAVWRAHSTNNRHATAEESPSAAAQAFFAKYPTARKCNVWEYKRREDGALQRIYDLTGSKAPLRDFNDVTAKAAPWLPLT